MQALSKKAGVEFSIADISGDDLMSQRKDLATQGVKVRNMSSLKSPQGIINQTHLNPGDVFWEASPKHHQLHERLLWRRTYRECFEQVPCCCVSWTCIMYMTRSKKMS